MICYILGLLHSLSLSLSSAGTTLPLMGATQNAQGMLPLPTRHYTAAIEDVRENMRAKIYAMCTKIGQQNNEILIDMNVYKKVWQ